jgi:preprotein translocase subunit SecE
MERGETISFFNELDIETRPMLITFVSFFNEVATEMQKISSKPLFHFLTRFLQRRKKLSSKVVSFFNELEIRKLCSKTFVSFFNEVASEMKKLSSKPLPHFLMRLLQRCKNYP